MAPCVAITVPIAGRPWQREDSAVSALDEGSVGRDNQMETSVGLQRERGSRNIPALFPRPRLNPATTALQTAPPTSSTPVDVVPAVRKEMLQIHQQREPQKEPCSPLGCMFRPELTKEQVLAVVSQVLCRPGFTLGARDERCLLKSVRTGRIDIRNMSRILRWLAGERTTLELRRRGIEFVGPKQATASPPYTTGSGMTKLVKEIIARHGAGTRFIVCFSSRFDACSSAIAGVLVNPEFPASGPASDFSCPSSGSVAIAGCGDGGAISEDARTVSTCSSFSDAEDDNRMAPCPSPLSVDLVPEPRQADAPEKGAGGTEPGVRSTSGGVGGVKASDISVVGSRTSAERANGDDGSPRGGVVALLFDEKPKHRLCNGGDGSGGGSPTTAGLCGGDGGVSGMPVQEWVEAYGECEGPMLAAWVFPGQ